MRTIAILLFVAVVAVAGLLLRRDPYKVVWNVTVVEDKPCNPETNAAPIHANVDMRSGGIASTDLPASTAKHGNATAPATAQPKSSPMLTELQRHFSRWESEQLEALYLETRKDVEFYALPAELRERMPAPTTSLADVRKRVKAIVGNDGFKVLMKEACPPKEVKPNTAEMEQFVLSNPQLVWWSQLLE